MTSKSSTFEPPLGTRVCNPLLGGGGRRFRRRALSLPPRPRRDQARELRPAVGQFVINVSGSFLLGLLTGLTLSHHLSDVGKALLGTGFCGAYTTFSTFTFETIRLVQDGRFLEAAGNVSVSVVVGLAAATAGLALGLAA